MRGTIQARGNGYRLAVRLGKNPETGKYDRYYEQFNGSSTDAKKRLTQILSEVDKGVFCRPGKASLAEYLTSWQNDYCISLAPRTRELYGYICRVHIIPEIGRILLKDLKPQRLQRLYSDKLTSGLSGRTVQLIHVVLHKSLKNAVKINLLSRNPADSVDKPRIVRPEMHVMDENQLNYFLQAAQKGEYYCLFYLYLMTGMRRSELLAVRWSDYDPLGMVISVNRSMQCINKAKNRITFKEPKSKKSRRLIALSPDMCLTLNKYKEKQNADRLALDLPALKDSDLIFCHIDGTPTQPDGITHAWMKLVRKCGLKGVRLHDARHTMASIMLKQGVHPAIVQQRLGHASISITIDTYSHILPGLQEAAAKGLDSILHKESKLDRELKELVQN